MRLTIEIADALLADALRFAAREGTTLCLLIESGLRVELTRRQIGNASFTLRDASFGGHGLQPPAATSGGTAWRALAYQSTLD